MQQCPYIYPPAHCPRLTWDIFACRKVEIPRWNTAPISGYYTFHVHVH
jgi:hypothetical protein